MEDKMKNLAFALINLFSTTIVFAESSIDYIACKGFRNNHAIVVEKNQFGIESAFYKKKTYSGMVLQTIALRKSWTKPNTFLSSNDAEKFKFEILKQPVLSPNQAPLHETKSVKITVEGRSIDDIENCLIDPKVSWTEQQY